MTVSTWHEFRGSGLWCEIPGCRRTRIDAVHMKVQPATALEDKHVYVANPACCAFPVDDAVHIETRYAHAPGAHTIDEAYEEFHRANPNVFSQIVELAREAQRRGAKHYGIAALFEVLRWNSMRITPDDDGFRLNNSLRAVYARKIMETHADLEGFFRTRARATESEDCES